ncbi:ABC transporter substrate-binding protein [Cecembia calidifontis]|jgi:hypothetical protein|nr:ABC transporter substrate-binding protein [Cecembia calidifontis]
MKKINIIGVPEHFNFPWIKVIERQPLKDEGIELVWHNESRGSGAMNHAIRRGEADLALILTESFIKDKIEGNPGKIIGWFVKSPLVWGIHLSSLCPVQSLSELKKPTFLISRYGSGSHLMAFLLAEREGWDPKSLQFEEIGNLDGAKKSFESPEPKIFLWEKFTTKPLVDQGLFKRINEIPTPWPCFVLVASEQSLNQHADVLKKIRDMVYDEAQKFKFSLNTSQAISEFYGIQKKDIEEWLESTSWAENNNIGAEELQKVIETLQNLQIIKNVEIKPNIFVDEALVNLLPTKLS